MVSPNGPAAVPARRWPEFVSHAMAILSRPEDTKPVAVTSANDPKAVPLQIQAVTTLFVVPAINPTWSLPAFGANSITAYCRSVALFVLSKYCSDPHDPA